MICRPRLSVPMTHSNHRRTSERCSYGCCGRPSASPVPEHWGDAWTLCSKDDSLLPCGPPSKTSNRSGWAATPTAHSAGSHRRRADSVGSRWRRRPLEGQPSGSRYLLFELLPDEADALQREHVAFETHVGTHLCYHLPRESRRLGPANAGRSSTATSPHPAGDHIASLSPT
jgi:hypothetical protein